MAERSAHRERRLRRRAERRLRALLASRLVYRAVVGEAFVAAVRDGTILRGWREHQRRLAQNPSKLGIDSGNIRG